MLQIILFIVCLSLLEYELCIHAEIHICLLLILTTEYSLWQIAVLNKVEWINFTGRKAEIYCIESEQKSDLSHTKYLAYHQKTLPFLWPGNLKYGIYLFQELD